MRSRLGLSLLLSGGCAARGVARPFPATVRDKCHSSPCCCARAQQRGQFAGPPQPPSEAVFCFSCLPSPRTAQRRGEPAWHRRERRARGNARALLRVAAAGRLLEGHHSAQRRSSSTVPRMPDASSRGKGGKGGGAKGGKGGAGGKSSSAGPGKSWDCPLCFLPANYGWRLRCRGCDAYQRRPDGVGGGGPGAANASGAHGGQSTNRGLSFAERQLQLAKNDQRKQRKDATERENKELREELARLRAAGGSGKASSRQSAAADKASGDDDEFEGDDMEISTNSYSDWTEEERQKRLEVAKSGLPYYIAKYGDDAEETEEVRDEIASLERASRDAKPFKTHRGLLERKRERLRARLEKDQGEIERIESEQEELRSKHEALQSAMAERSKLLAQVEEELAELVKRALAEGDAAGPAGRQGDDSSAPWSPLAASAILQTLASKPGVPPEFAALLGHVYQAAQALAAASAAAGPGAATAAAGTHDLQANQPRAGRQPPKTGAGAGVSDGVGSLAAGPPSQLAPQGRWNKPGTSSTGGSGATSAVSQGSGAGGQTAEAEAGGRESRGTPAATGAAAATSATGQTGKPPSAEQKTEGAATEGQDGSDQDPELIDAEMDDNEIDGEVAASIINLPTAVQARLRAALGARGGRRRRGGGDDGERSTGDRERERSPRPTKAAGADGDI